MKKEQIFGKYFGKPLDIQGFNLPERQGVKFDHLCEHSFLGLELVLTYNKLYRELVDECKKEGISFLSADFRKRKKALEAEVYRRQSNGELNLTGEHRQLLEYLEDLYFKFFEADITVEQMQIEEGRVIVPKNQVYHECNLSTLSQFESYADIGIVATEWFGEFESESEGRYCTFVKDDSTGTNYEGNYSLPTAVRFYIDSNNPLWKQLDKLDFFEYEHIKKTSPEKIPELYPQKIIDLYEQIISPLSGGGKSMHDSPETHTYTWRAIPGGIPPQLIVGVQIGSKNEQLIKQVKEIQKLFPNAVIFNEQRKVLSQRKDKNDEDSLE